MKGSENELDIDATACEEEEVLQNSDWREGRWGVGFSADGGETRKAKTVRH
jgi:hypothetical protein